ncbi:SDR family NAD(P)-dependent oxidoreductase, partial [Streptomyces sp. NPDC094038]|uniref:SDR family NAD(P)-dependent oxidoreductase n=1 Tax=Streptomyces sp. NPDC094038 TaxID=3366055 RepID=UPI0038151F6C
QGSQWVGMGRQLMSWPVFAETMDECEQALAPLLPQGLLKVMFAEPSDPLAALLEDTVFAQAGLFAVGVALGRLVRSWGVRPDFVAGHSVGEITAACVAGVLPLPSACALVAARGQLMRQLPPGGAMAAVNADLATMAKFLAQYPQVSLAAVNGPSAVVVSGPEPAVTQVCAALTDAGHKCTRLRVSHGFHSALMDPILGELRQVLRGVPWREAHVPLVSTVTGKIIGPEQWNDPAHWLANARDTVRFADTVRTLHDNGVDTYIELGPDATLTAMIPDNLPEGDGGQALAVPVLRRDRDDRVSALTAAARLFTAGIAVDWSAVPASAASATVSSRAARIELPTYAFQRRRFWPTPVAARSDVSEVGQVVVDHPLLGAGLELPESGGVVFTGRVSLRSSPWLADHVVSGSVLFPGAGFVDLVSYAGEQLGYGRVEELLLHVPLVVPDGGASHIQVVLAASDNDGARPVSVYARPDTGTGIDYGEGDGGWVCYATGQLLATGTETDATREHSLPPVWPPAGAIAVDVEDLYIRLADQGFDYGPVFRGVQVLWRRGEDVFAEIALADGVSADAAAFGIHPALLDIAMHALAAGERLSPTEQASTDAGNAAAGGVLAPFSFSGVTVHTVGASMGRVHVRPVGPGSVSVSVFDLAGDPVITVDRLTLREVDLRGHETADVDRSLFQVHWTPTLPTATATATAPTTATVAATAAVGAADWLFLGSPAPAMPGAGIVKDREELVADIRAGVAAPPVLAVVLQEPAGLETLTAVRALAAEVLEHLQWWLRNEDVFDDSRLLFLSRNAVQADAGAGDGMPSVAMAAIWGLVRAAQAENPGRFVLADLDESAASWQALPAAVLGGEPQLMLRGGRVLTPRMQKLLPGDELSAPRPWDRNGTVLITGGLSGLGAVMARHAVVEHGIRHLLLLGRRAARTPGAQDLMAELAGLGARVGVIGCDVADRDQLAAALEEISPAHPLTAVIHAAGVLDDGVVEAMTPQRLDTTLAPKLDAAWHLHELTSQEDLAAFVVFSSVSGILGSAGQGNYAAANAGLDALIGMRRTMGQPGLSLAWGLWQQTGMAAHLGRADVKRLAGAGFREITATEGVAMFDRALGSMVPLVVAMPLNLRIVQQQRQVPHLLRGLIRDVRHDAAAGDGSGGLRQRLERVDADVRLAVVSELVRSEVAAVLGHTGADAVDAHRAFNEIGFDSLSAVELRNRLTTATGLKLPATLIFDYPSSHVLADYLVTRIDGSPRSKPPILPSPAGAMTEPIAIVGMACRFPGGVTAPDDLWKMVVDGTDAIGDFPLDRGWDVGELVDPSGVRTNSTYVGRGGFLYEAAAFDPAFFGISPNEALVMDPQQRLLLEVSWEAVERAGIDPLSLKGSSTGVFAGMMYHDYRSNSNTGSIASGRVSYVLGLEGPAVTVDTACSSSLVSL